MSANRKKVLLMGKSGSGKTSMRSIIFANYLARETSRINPTLDVEHSHVRFLGNLVLSLWDCGGQDTFYENYFDSQRDHIFPNVEVLIYVFDIDSSELDKDFRYYDGCIDAIAQNSPDAQVFCLLHKMDLVQPESKREEVFNKRAEMIKNRSQNIPITCFGTSIWDETLYKAWSSIVYSLIPNVSVVEQHLNEFADACDADEVVLFERATFLVISHVTRKEHLDPHRFEKISNIIKQFKLSCTKSHERFAGMTVKNRSFSSFIEQFTSNTYVMVITSDSSLLGDSTALNIRVARPHFEKILQQTQGSGSEGFAPTRGHSGDEE